MTKFGDTQIKHTEEQHSQRLHFLPLPVMSTNIKPAVISKKVNPRGNRLILEPTGNIAPACFALHCGVQLPIRTVCGVTADTRSREGSGSWVVKNGVTHKSTHHEYSSLLYPPSSHSASPSPPCVNGLCKRELPCHQMYVHEDISEPLNINVP